MVDLSIIMLVDQRVISHKIPLSHHSITIKPPFSYGFPRVSPFLREPPGPGSLQSLPSRGAVGPTSCGDSAGAAVGAPRSLMGARGRGILFIGKWWFNGGLMVV